MKTRVHAIARRACHFALARLTHWLSPHQTAVARLAAAWFGHLLFPRSVGEPDARLLAEVHRHRPGGAPMPDWALTEMRVQAEFEPLLFPSAARMQLFHFYRIPYEFEAPGRAFGRLYAVADRETVDHILFVPWLKVGGADRAALLHAEAMTSFGKKVLVIATEPGNSPWAQRLPAGVRFLPAGEALAALDATSRHHVLARLVLQLQPESVHIVHSVAAWETVHQFGLALSGATRIYASAFCDDITPEGERISAARLHARDCSPFLTGVFTDCRYYADVLTRETGIGADRVHVLYLPVGEPAGPLWSAPSGPPTVLWAGRFDRQKRPDILARIAGELPDVRFEVYGTPVTDRATEAVAQLARLPNVSLHGAYDGFESLPWRECNLFLYTSQWDGLPNVLLEAAVRGMPIVAPAVGGIPELLDKEVLVRRHDDVTGFVTGVRKAMAQSELRLSARERLASHHDRGRFLQETRKRLLGADSAARRHQATTVPH